MSSPPEPKDLSLSNTTTIPEKRTHDPRMPLRPDVPQMIAPHFEAMSSEFPGAVFVKVDVDAMDKVRLLLNLPLASSDSRY